MGGCANLKDSISTIKEGEPSHIVVSPRDFEVNDKEMPSIL
jgi:hypothetical protein